MPHPQHSLDVVLEGDNRLPRARLPSQYTAISQVLHSFDLVRPQINRTQDSVLFEILSFQSITAEKLAAINLLIRVAPDNCNPFEPPVIIHFENHDVFLSMSYSDGRIQMVVRWLTSSFCSHSRAEKVMIPPPTNRKYQTVQPVSSYSAQRSVNSARRMSFPYSQIRIYGSCPSLCGLLYSLTTELLGRWFPTCVSWRPTPSSSSRRGTPGRDLRACYRSGRHSYAKPSARAPEGR
nr:MAG TPA: hypothetical protein [Caudoviricetes sp.]